MGNAGLFPPICPAPQRPLRLSLVLQVLAAKPKQGNAVLFHSIKPTGELERLSLHTACPVIKGVKWSAPKWVHVGHYAAGGEAPVEIPQHTQVGSGKGVGRWKGGSVGNLCRRGAATGGLGPVKTLQLGGGGVKSWGRGAG